MAMKTYEITHKETLVKHFEVEASSEEEAMKKYWKMSMNGELDFSDEDVETSEDYISSSM